MLLTSRVANGLLATGGEVYTKLKIAFLAADILWEFVSSNDPTIKRHVQEVDLMAWVDNSVLAISRRHSFLARSAMQQTECLKRTLKAIEVMNDPELLHQFTLPSTPRDPCDPAEDHHIKELFSRFDTDKSGKIDADELHLLLRELGHICMHEESLRILGQMDTNGDGEVDRLEFMQWWYYEQSGKF